MSCPQRARPILAAVALGIFCCAGGTEAQETDHGMEAELVPPVVVEKNMGKMLAPWHPNAAGNSRSSERLLDPDAPTLETIEFRDTPLLEAIRLLIDQVDMKIVPTSAAAEVKVSLYLRDVQPLVALDALTRAHGLFWRKDPETEIIRIYTVEEYEADLASFREEETEVFTLLYPNPMDIAFAIRDLYGDRVVLNLGGISDIMVSQDLMQRFGRFNMINMQNSQGAGGLGGGIGGGMGGGMGMGGMGMGGMGMGGMGMGGMGMGGNQMPEPLPPLEGLSTEEIQMLEAARADAESTTGRVAIDELLRRQRARIFLSVIRRQNQLIVRTADRRTMEQIRQLVYQLDVPTPLVLLEVKVLALELDDGFNSVFDYQFTDGKLTAGQFTTGNVLPPPADLVSGTARRFQSVAPGGTGLNPSDMIFQIVSDSFRARVQLLENKNRVTEVATPMLLTANNEVSRIFIGQTLPVTVGFTPPTVFAGPITTNVALAGTPITQLQDLGQSLIVTPSINADRTVTLRLGQQNSRLVPAGARIPVPTADGGIIEQSIDTVQRTSITGTVVARDGLTVAIGGLIEDTITDSRAQVPVLGKIPGLGFFFRRQATGRSRTELVVLIRPYVFNTPQESAACSAELIPDLSLHPMAAEPHGSLQTFAPAEVLRPDPPNTHLQSIFRFHSVRPKAY